MAVARTHTYSMQTTWSGNDGSGTSSYRSYRRDHEIVGPGKAQPILGSSDAAFRGDASRYNPEELLVASLSACHMLWVLHLCANSGIVVTDYTDAAEGVMRENPDGSGQFVDVVLNPVMTIADASRATEAEQLHERAHALCFVARSVNFPVTARARVQVARPTSAQAS
jgi:organic hydroperoxide reductase OsmC/OhrA